MASDNVLNKLWELVQRENEEELDEKSFKEDFSNSVYAEVKKLSGELTNINDEVDRTLLIVLKQAERNPQVLGNSKGNEFSISPAIITKAVKTVKYENRFIPGTVEYNKKEVQENSRELKEVILTPVLISKMLKNYEELSADERKKIVDNFSELSYDERSAFFKANQRMAHKFSKSSKLSEEGRNLAKKTEERCIIIEQLNEALKNNNQKKIRELLEEHSDLNEYVKMYMIKNPNATEQEALEKLSQNQAKEIKETNELFEKQSHLKTLRTLLALPEKTEEIIDEINSYKRRWKIEFEGEELESYINEQIIKIEKKIKVKDKNKEFEVDKDENPNKLNSKVNGAENLDNIEPDKNSIEKKEDSFKNKNEEQQFSEQDMLSALNHFKEYFQEFDEETLEEISELTPEEIIANLKDDFNDMLKENKIDSKTKQMLDLFADNITSSTKEILLDSQKREDFFEQMQGNITKERITDAEITELFERLSEELKVAPFEPVKESNEQTNIEFGDFTSLLQNSEVDSMYIINGIEMMVDEEATRAAVDAQERGENPEKAILEYYEKLEKEKTGPDRETDGKEDYVQPEVIVIDEREEQAQEQDVVIQDETYKVTEDIGEELQEDDIQDKNVVVIKKDKEGAIQVFRPSTFLKVVKKSEVTFDQVKNEQMDLARIVEQEREDKSITSKGNGSGSEPVQEEQRD